MRYMTVSEAAAKWGLTARSVQLHCLKHDLTPFVIAENLRQFYYLWLQDWRKGRRARLLDTCRTGQDVFILGLRQFGHVKLAEKAEAAMGASRVRTY